MTIDDFVTELKVYLKIDDTDITNDGIIKQAAQMAAGYIVANYSYYILNTTVDKEFFAEDSQAKYYVNAGPTTAVVAYVNDVEVVDNPSKVFNNTVYFDSTLGVVGDHIKLTSTVGIDITKESHKGDFVSAAALAAYLYKQADKGLDGVSQYGTGIKESARLFEGIPKHITSYFETRKVFRF